MLDTSDFHTETFTNSQGWTVVRVTHAPSGERAERERSKQLASSVQAQSECIAELRDRLGPQRDADVIALTPDRPAHRSQSGTDVSRAEFDALARRVAALEEQLDSADQRG